MMKKIKQVLFGGVVVVAEFALSVGCSNEFSAREQYIAIVL